MVILEIYFGYQESQLIYEKIGFPTRAVNYLVISFVHPLIVI